MNLARMTVVRHNMLVMCVVEGHEGKQMQVRSELSQSIRRYNIYHWKDLIACHGFKVGEKMRVRYDF
ncbi:hypothetical protein OROMI_034536 [Orobanche minor]